MLSPPLTAAVNSHYTPLPDFEKTLFKKTSHAQKKTPPTGFRRRKRDKACYLFIWYYVFYDEDIFAHPYMPSSASFRLTIS